MAGKVYCFNCFNETINNFNVNGMSVGSVPGWALRMPGIYTPSSIAVARARHGDGQVSPVFSSDMPTPIRIDWDSYTVHTTIDLRSFSRVVSLDEDLIVYLAVNQATVVSMRGLVLLSVPYSPAG